MKNRKNLRIVSLVLAIVFVASVCVFADPDSREQPNRATVTTYFDVNYEPGYIYTMVNNAGSTYGSVPAPTRSGYVFLGWFPESFGEDDEITGSTIVPTESRTVYAHWAVPRGLYNVGSGKMLNIDGSNLTWLYNGMNVTVWQNSGSNEQKWLYDNCQNKFYIKSYVDRAFGLNAYRSGDPWNCNIRSVIGNETDAQVRWSYTPTPDWSGYSLIELKNYGLFLTAGGSANGSNVYWAPYDAGNSYQYWY